MIKAFLYEHIAITVRHWFEINLDTAGFEHGVRVEVRLREPQAHRGTESAAQRIVIDDTAWRADIFEKLDSPPGSLSAFHYHPTFDGDEPTPRVWDGLTGRDPWEWLAEQLSDVATLLRRNGLPTDRLRDDQAAITADVPTIVEIAQTLQPSRCRDAHQCFEWTKDQSATVRLMQENMAEPEKLDVNYVKPWLERA